MASRYLLLRAPHFNGLQLLGRLCPTGKPHEASGRTFTHDFAFQLCLSERLTGSCRLPGVDMGDEVAAARGGPYRAEESKVRLMAEVSPPVIDKSPRSLW